MTHESAGLTCRQRSVSSKTDRRVEVGGDGFLRVVEGQANRDGLAEWAEATEDKPAH
jgi:hypothetical protein